MSPEAPERFALQLRVPHWSARTQVQLNGEPQLSPTPGRYLVLEREWQAGDVIELSLDMGLRLWAGERECEGKASLFRGPLLLAYDPRFGAHDPRSLPELGATWLEAAPVPWSRPPLPLVLLKLPAGDGAELVLCDFATAGAAGHRYVSWLPVRGGVTQPFSRTNPSRTRSTTQAG